MSVTVASTKNNVHRIRAVHSFTLEVLAEATSSSAMTAPRNPLPTSPMKIFAGGQFHQRNPAAEAARQAATYTRPESPAVKHSMALAAAQTNSASLPASPSIPSMKLNRLMNQTMAVAVVTDPTQPR
jgi:hypothetical protein